MKEKIVEAGWVRRIGSVVVAGSYVIRVAGTPGAASAAAQQADQDRRVKILDAVAAVPELVQLLVEAEGSLAPSAAELQTRIRAALASFDL